MNVKFILNTILIAIIANIVSFLWARHAFLPVGLVATSAILLGLLLFVLAALIRGFTKNREDAAAKLSLRMTTASAIVCFTLLACVPFVVKTQKNDLQAARTRAEALIPLLQARMDSTGAYPESLAEIAGAEPLPWLLQEPDAYRSTGTGYVMQIRHPGTPTLADVRQHNQTRWRVMQ